MTLKKNNRRNLRKDRNRIKKLKPKIIINKFSHFDNLVKLAKERFAKKGEETDWEDKRRIDTFRYVIRLRDRSYKIRMVSIKIGNRIAGVDLNAIYNGTYYTLKCGYDVYRFPGIGNFMNLFEIDDAISLGLKRVDFLQNNYNWKSQYFPALPLLIYEK
jgi:CelD/BcsL family acetyltransferase involved in cellulose biosynthesis